MTFGLGRYMGGADNPDENLTPPLPSTPPPRTRRLDRLYTLTDAGFREAVVVDDSKEALPACFPETYGDEYEVSLLEVRRPILCVIRSIDRSIDLLVGLTIVCRVLTDLEVAPSITTH